MLYENIIAKFRNTQGWSEDIKCNIEVKQACPLSPTLFDIYIDKLESCFETTIYVDTTLAGIVINFVIHVMILFY